MSTNPEHSSPPAVPGAPELRSHVFDGIEEYDQKLPNWWLFTFYFTIAWFAIYWFLYYQIGWFENDRDRVTAGIAQIQAIKAKELEAMLSKLDDKVIWEWSRNSAIVAEGKGVYDRICFTCHAADLSAKMNGAPLPGLPLNDKEWKYSIRPMDMFNMVAKGSPDKNVLAPMPPWEQVLSPAEMAKVVAYVLSHHDEADPGKVEGAAAPPAPAAEAPAPPTEAPVVQPTAPATGAPAPTAPAEQPK
jgi:cytochrome c oxidase cbb3-type subunit 3